MVFSSTVFLLLFLPLVLTIYYNPLFKSRKFKNYFLLFASLFFYAWGEPFFIILMILSIVITWSCGVLIARSNNKSKFILGIGLSYLVLQLFVFKYLTFIAQQLGLLFNKDFSMIKISLPIGISFFSFQLMSYLLDVYFKKTEAQKNLLYVGLYVSFFPQLIAGPIVKYKEIVCELYDRKESYDEIVAGMRRFIYGLAKKVLLADYLAQIADNSFDYLIGQTSVAMSWLGAICYTLQIYYDFSGYSDMALGLGKMFGFHFDENFNYPYISKSIKEFWRRWHISLGLWFRDYVYIPLGGNRVNKMLHIRNLFVVWLLTGLWHGANWTFVIWGLFYFFVLLIEKKFNYGGKSSWLSHIYTMFIVIIAWVIFRADSIEKALVYIGNMFGIGATSFVDAAFVNNIKSTFSVVLLGMIGVTPCIKCLLGYLRNTKCRLVVTLWEMFLFVLSIFQVISSTYNPFIYFNF